MVAETPRHTGQYPLLFPFSVIFSLCLFGFCNFSFFFASRVVSAVGGLGVTRALGDYFFYPFVSSEPKISKVDFSTQSVIPSEMEGEREVKEENGRSGGKHPEGGKSPRDNYLILASDGVWDTVRDEDGAKCVMEYPQDILRASVLIRDTAYLKSSRGFLFHFFISSVSRSIFSTQMISLPWSSRSQRFLNKHFNFHLFCLSLSLSIVC
jgi:hypothetical protein